MKKRRNDQPMAAPYQEAMLSQTAKPMAVPYQEAMLSQTAKPMTTPQERLCLSDGQSLTLRFKIVNAISFVYKILRPILGYKSCRFTPTCSEYAFASLKKHGVLKAFCFTIKRIFKCHPYHPGGFDPVP